MNHFLLFTVSILFLQNNIHAFRTIKPIIKNKHDSTTRLASILLIPPEDDPKRKKKIDILSQPNPFSEFQPRQDPNYPLYTVFWKKCRECTELLEEMEARGLRVVFIDGQAIFDIIWDEPIVYKNEEILVGWFDIYEEIFYEKGTNSNAQAPPFVSKPPPFQ